MSDSTSRARQAGAASAGHVICEGQATVAGFEFSYHEFLKRSTEALLLIDLARGELCDASPAAEQLFGAGKGGLPGKPLARLCPAYQADGQESASFIAQQIDHALAGHTRPFQLRCAQADGRRLECELRMVLMPTRQGQLMQVSVVDITQRKREQQLQLGQTRLLEMVAIGAPLRDTLDSLMLLIEQQSDGVYCSVLLLDDDGVTMRRGGGPSLPSAYAEALDGIEIGPSVGSCGTAMFRKAPVVVADIVNDPLWAPYKALVEPYGLRACWSTPIHLSDGQVLGSFAMYYKEVRTPVEEDMRLIAVATHLAGIAIERTRRERELNQHREHLEELVAARTNELTLAKERTDNANRELASALANLSMAQVELVRRDKLAALGTLVAGVAHELNTPIGNSLVVATTMVENTRALAMGMEAGLKRSTLENYLGGSGKAGEILVRNLQRAADLVSSFKEVAVNHSGSRRERFSLSRMLAELVLHLSASKLQRNISIQSDLAPHLKMESFLGPLSQVINILFDNCLVHAFADNAVGTISITAAAAGEDVVISIADDGAGIPGADVGRVFDPFFTSRLGAGSSGLGLHVAHNVVVGVLGGRIELTSELGRGTTFTLTLPAIAPSRGSEAVTPPQ